MKVLSKSIPVKLKLAYLLTMQYTKSYGRAVLFGKDIWLFDLTFLKNS